MLNQIISGFVSIAITLSVTACTTNQEISKPDISIETENINDDIM